MPIFFDEEKKYRYPFLEVKVKDQNGNEEDLKDPDDEEDPNYSNPTDDNNDSPSEEPTDDSIPTTTSADESDDQVDDYSADDGDESTPETTEENPEGDSTPNDDEPDDYSQDNNEPNSDENPTDDNINPPSEEDNEPDDYSNTGDDVPTGDEPDTTSDETPTEEPPPTEEGDKLENIENELFSNLTPEQIEIKHKELKKLYISLYDSTGHIVDRINNTSKSSRTFEVINFIIDQLSKLRSILLDYLVDNYPNHTYFENLLNYNQYLGIMSGINQLLDQLPSENE